MIIRTCFTELNPMIILRFNYFIRSTYIYNLLKQPVEYSTTYKCFSEVEHDLEGNYCRNPGFGTEPWCYTDAETCARAYCDACQMRT